SALQHSKWRPRRGFLFHSRLRHEHAQEHRNQSQKRKDEPRRPWPPGIGQGRWHSPVLCRDSATWTERSVAWDPGPPSRTAGECRRWQRRKRRPTSLPCSPPHRSKEVPQNDPSGNHRDKRKTVQQPVHTNLSLTTAPGFVSLFASPESRCALRKRQI